MRSVGVLTMLQDSHASAYGSFAWQVRALAFDVAVGEEHLLHRVEELLHRLHGR